MTDEIDAPSFRSEYHFVLDDVPQPGPWVRAAACRTAPDSIFFVQRGESTAPAKAVCAACGVREQCLEYALAAGDDLKGIWGGLSGRERIAIRRAPRADTSTSNDVKRVATPAGVLYEKLDALRGHPNRWARVAEYPSKNSASAVGSLLRNGHRPKPSGKYDLEARLAGDGSELYARYLGADE